MNTLWMKILYTALLIAAALFSALYLKPFSVLLLLLLLVIPVLMALCVLYIRLHLKVSLQQTSRTGHRKSPQSALLVVQNTGLLPVGKAVASILCTCENMGQKLPVSLTFPIPARNTITVEFRMTAAHCGLTRMQLQWMKFSDFFRLFGWKMRVHPETHVLVLPKGEALSHSIFIPGSETDEESDLYSRLKAGDDPSEVYRIREYQPGDLQKRIHWKLSCRTDTVWVKEYSLPLQNRAAVLIDYRLPDKNALEALDVALDTAYVLCLTLIRDEIPLTLYWYEDGKKQLVWNEIHSAEELSDSLETLLSQRPGGAQTDFLQALSEEGVLRNINALFYCTPVWHRADGESLSQMLRENRLHVLTPDVSAKESGQPVFVRYIEEKTITRVLREITQDKGVHGQ